MIHRRVLVGSVVVALAAVAGYTIRSASAGGIPAASALSYAGVLEDANGPISGNHNIQVSLYDAAANGNLLCQTASTPVSVANGHFNAQLPNACTTAVAATSSVWVDVIVDGSDTGRTPIGAVPYAVEASHAVNATNASTAASAAAGTFAVPGSLAVTGNASVGGTLSVGLQISTSCVAFNGSYIDCTCGANQIAIGGGAYSGGGGTYLDESRSPSFPQLGSTWRLGCQTSAGTRVGCAWPYAMCARLAP
jgi:hypothetical protein